MKNEKQIKEMQAGVSTDTLHEHKVSSEEIFDGVVMHVTRDTVRLPNGKLSTREVAWHNGAVAVLPVFDDESVLVEHQFRYAHGRVILEIPAGKLDTPDEEPLSAAKRELREETGYTAARWTYLGAVIPSVALLSERIHLFLAEELTKGDTEPDEDEFLIVERVPFARLFDAVMNGEIQDSKTQIAVLKYAARQQTPQKEG